MLKKLVKYGNSTALIIDKAILELLNIEEGSVIKIKTDGKSLIISPQENSSEKTAEKINETFTSTQALKEATAAQFLKYYPNIDANKKELLEKKLVTLMEKQQVVLAKLASNPIFSEELSKIGKQFEQNPSAFTEAYNMLIDKFYPELTTINKEFENFYIINGLESPTIINEKQKREMTHAFYAAFKKNVDTRQSYCELSNNLEYQNELQILAEKYKNDKNSENYLKEYNELTGKYLPEFVKLQENLKTIAKNAADNLKK